MKVTPQRDPVLTQVRAVRGTATRIANECQISRAPRSGSRHQQNGEHQMAKAADTSNQFDTAVVQNLVGKIEDFFVDLDSERGTYMQRCRNIRESISAVYDEAKARGIPKKEL